MLLKNIDNENRLIYGRKSILINIDDMMKQTKSHFEIMLDAM